MPSAPLSPQYNLTLDSIKSYKYIYFLGIGGIGMSGLARWFNANDYIVAGYDRVSTPLTQALESEGISITYQDSIDVLPNWVTVHQEQVLVILTPAIPKDHKQWAWFADRNYPIYKRAKVLGLIASAHKTLAVAGTHGKTTTSTILAHLLHHAGLPTTAFLGGIARNFNSNLVLSNKPAHESWLVAEADEFDRSFLHLHPDMAVLTSTDADHLDIYGQAEELKTTFQLFVNQIKPGGFFVKRAGLEPVAPSGVTTTSFDLDNSDVTALNLKVEGGLFCFDAKLATMTVAGIKLQMPGYHNVTNALAAASIAEKVGLTSDQIRDGLNTFRGVARRFELVKATGTILIDDYAHHPTEIEAFLKSVKALYPGKRITAIFQPHLFTRTRDFLNGFAESLALADEVILLDIYPARELPIPGMTSEKLLELIPIQQKLLLPKQRLLGYLANKPLDIVCTIGAGDIDALVQPIAKMLK